jgi:NTE family protein
MEHNETVGLALGGGAVLGASHIGTLKALEEYGIVPDMISGTSIGALIASFYAFGISIEEMEEIAINLRWLDISSLSLSRTGLLSNRKLGNIIEDKVGDANIEDANIPLAMISTDLSSGEKVVFTEGDVATAVMASSCIPGIFSPVETDGRMLVDGALVENVPVSALENMQADKVVAADVNAKKLYEKPNDIIEVVTNALDIAIDNLSRPKSEKVDLLIRPELSEYSRTEIDPEKIKGLIEEGYNVAYESLSKSSIF